MEFSFRAQIPGITSILQESSFTPQGLKANRREAVWIQDCGYENTSKELERSSTERNKELTLSHSKLRITPETLHNQQ